ncbi:acetyl/propionyl/methylcrotonyl-CoA carboxylase subunit alpha [Thermodesulfobacteriota bacterium]
MFNKILIANRGEIAVRVIRTCREMGIKTVAVYSEADSTALHVLEADESVFLGESDPSESYLSIPKIMNAAKEKGAQAIHPGYGFLAENSSFANACEEQGVAFIGPPSKAIQDLGDKTVARDIMIKSGVPVIPGMTHSTSNLHELSEEADRIGYPVLVKAAAGGGGKGMRVAESLEDLEQSFESARSEALAAFGDGSLYLEKRLQSPRHIEFQILADTHGNFIHLLERECSIQRRHQKIIEETPSPVMSPEIRHKMGQAAVAAARASGYVNAGTVEFLVDSDMNFYFLEVNTRLQVEHPITEFITGLDLVRKQIEIAAGLPLNLDQERIVGRGHAIECRIYAEDPENDFFPSPGKILFMKEPSGPGIRNDSGVYSGFQVPVEYDPILSKLIVHCEDRDQAVSRMLHALSHYVILGIKTPIPFLIDVLKSSPFKNGKTHTDFIDLHFSGWKNSTKEVEASCLAFIADTLAGPQREKVSMIEDQEIASPWNTLGHWRL